MLIVNRTNGVATPLAPSLENLIAADPSCVARDCGRHRSLHLACALERPVVGIYGPTDRSGTVTFGTRFKSAAKPCKPAATMREKMPEAGLLTIQPDEVLSAAEELLYAKQRYERAQTLLQESTPRKGGRGWRVAFAYLSASRLRRCMFLNCGTTLPNQKQLPGALPWWCPGFGCGVMAAGYVKKNRELTQTGPYATHPQSTLFGIDSDCRWIRCRIEQLDRGDRACGDVPADLCPGHCLEERFLRSTFPEFDGYCRRVPRLIPRLSAAEVPRAGSAFRGRAIRSGRRNSGNFSFALYLRHREYIQLLEQRCST